uniref:SRP54-type proteins GTP-binding domain-containing protein n=1 Tax=Chromera velia CCMP2878 TaxID=1169474 RepID=A0A0G4I771_9ALVE|mmetsp:Transcript_32974/g.65285  ORF Transcript_32974/g.65285 Transcript_32974/m.65285 type:complete len:555 (+) Transcript_32974:147-1811(+)|eukprot:Cvel_11603.t1-p1 / transcript=Cvel_11603.t1 / gene=Cvel_11603 / organism=Chromera_velia_CCMP2878 / gene_product=Signal recognition particle receptor FtsY, putative / transcript_product=Signal recognition particle receptor FtsY, putative / location=Cvel_scaffold734:44319-48863(-) / protein_length=554 / sequence_SO=supercontig / SO=protein_coding / is_pseudo=false
MRGVSSVGASFCGLCLALLTLCLETCGPSHVVAFSVGPGSHGSTGGRRIVSPSSYASSPSPLLRRRVGGRQGRSVLQMQLPDVFGWVKQTVEKNVEAAKENISKFQAGLTKSRDQFLGNIDQVFSQSISKNIEELLEDLEETLLSADLGSVTTFEILEELRETAKKKRLTAEGVKELLRTKLLKVLTTAVPRPDGQPEPEELRYMGPEKVTVYIFMGSNGMGKTTTIGKISNKLRREGKRVLVAACDTYRAAAVEQLEKWTDRAQVDIQKPQEGERRPQKMLKRVLEEALVPVEQEVVEEKVSKAGEVVETVTRKVTRPPYDVIIVDTSGRLSNNIELVDEMKAVKNACKKIVRGGAPHETLLVVDASIGRNAVDQAKIWDKEIGLSGLVVTKLDGTARAGFVVSTVRDLGLPVKLVGVGERIDDLRNFDPDTYVDALFGYDKEIAAQYEKALEKSMRESMEKEKEVQRLMQEMTKMEFNQMKEQMAQRFARGGNEEEEETEEGALTMPDMQLGDAPPKPKAPKPPTPVKQKAKVSEKLADNILRELDLDDDDD